MVDVQGLSPERIAALMKMQAMGGAQRPSARALLPGQPVRIARCACASAPGSHDDAVGVLVEVRSDGGQLVSLVWLEPTSRARCRAADVHPLAAAGG